MKCLTCGRRGRFSRSQCPACRAAGHVIEQFTLTTELEEAITVLTDWLREFDEWQVSDTGRLPDIDYLPDAIETVLGKLNPQPV